jgi:arabinose-5-phosphate isomerase
MLSIAKRVFEIEIESLKNVAASLDEQFESAVKLVLQSNKVIISGLGKSGLIARKTAATLTSTGTSSYYIHPSEAFHGDLGNINKADVVILFSYSGETDELLKLIPFLKWNNNKLIAVTGNPESTLAKNADCCLNVHVEQEACPLQLAPTSSTTAALVMGDALAIALMESRGFQVEDFARFHPGGSLGRKLLVRLKDIMRKDDLPFISIDATFTQLVLRMSEGRLGMVIVGNAQKVDGIITDGDLRRALVKFPNIQHITLEQILNPRPLIVDENEHAFAAEQIMIARKITTILVADAYGVISGTYQIFNL